MSHSTTTDDDSTDDDYTRQPAARATIAEINQAKFEFKFDDRETAPKYQLAPSGKPLNRVLVAGTITDVRNASSEDNPYFRAQLVGPTGDRLYLNAGQYQPQAVQSFFATLAADDSDPSPPIIVAVSGKMDVYPEDEPIEERKVSITPEWVTEVPAETRHRIIHDNAVATIDRFQTGPDTAEAEKALALVEEKYATDENFHNTDFVENAISVLEEISTQVPASGDVEAHRDVLEA